MPGVLIGVPRERFMMVQAIDNLLKVAKGLRLRGLDVQGDYNLHWGDGHRVDRNRDGIVNAFLAHPGEPDWLLFLDSDMEFPWDIGSRLVSRGKQLIGGLYFHRKSHDPLAFRHLGLAPDRYGRNSHSYECMRDEVYDFLASNGVPNKDGSLTLDDPVGDPLLEVDAMGTGAMLIHRSVIEQMELPLFEYSDFGESEDLTFCRRAKEELGVQPVLDLSTISGHYEQVPMGQAQFRMNYEGRGLTLSSFTEDQAVEWLQNFLNIEKDQADTALKKYQQGMLAQQWQAYIASKGRGFGTVTDFYRGEDVGTLYLYDLLHWNASAPFNNIRKALTHWRNSRVLEIGGGIGTTALQLAIQRNTVTVVEPNKMLAEFIAYRLGWLRRKIGGTMGEIKIYRSLADVPPDEIDLCVAIDTFEHISETELPLMLKDIGDRLRDGGRLFTHNTWGIQDVYPMHFDHSAHWEGWLTDAGILSLGETWNVRKDRGLELLSEEH